jgi:PmbA protein
MASEVFFQRSEFTSLTFSGGELKTRETSEESGYGVRVLKDGRLGFAYCQDKEKLDDAKRRAEKLSKFSPKTGFSFPGASSFKTPDIFDKNLDPSDFQTYQSLVEQAREAAESFGARSKIVISAHKSYTHLENSEGFSAGYDDTGFSMYAEVMHGEGLGIGYISSNHLTDVKEEGLNAAGMARDMQNAKKPKSGKYTVVAQIEALDTLLEVLLPSFSGDWKRRGITSLPGKRFSEMLSVFDDPLSGGTSSRPFDDEGVPSEKRTLIDNGDVTSYLFDLETAALANEDGGGSCSRDSYDGNPSIGSSNILLSPGDWNDLGEIGKYIELHYAHGSHTANLTTGDVGLEVSGAFLVEGDKRTPLKGFMLSANIFDMFSNIEAVESKTRTLGSLTAPRIAFRDVHVVS